MHVVIQTCEIKEDQVQQMQFLIPPGSRQEGRGSHRSGGSSDRRSDRTGKAMTNREVDDVYSEMFHRMDILNQKLEQAGIHADRNEINKRSEMIMSVVDDRSQWNQDEKVSHIEYSPTKKDFRKSAYADLSPLQCRSVSRPKYSEPRLYGINQERPEFLKEVYSPILEEEIDIEYKQNLLVQTRDNTESKMTKPGNKNHQSDKGLFDKKGLETKVIADDSSDKITLRQKKVKKDEDNIAQVTAPDILQVKSGSDFMVYNTVDFDYSHSEERSEESGQKNIKSGGLDNGKRTAI